MRGSWDPLKYTDVKHLLPQQWVVLQPGRDSWSSRGAWWARGSPTSSGWVAKIQVSSSRPLDSSNLKAGDGTDMIGMEEEVKNSGHGGMLWLWYRNYNPAVVCCGGDGAKIMYPPRRNSVPSRGGGITRILW